jgi:hypothetical protein
MSERDSHKFQFTASQIAFAARREAEYHGERLKHWLDRESAALEKTRGGLSARIVEQQITGGVTYTTVVDFGDPEAWKELQLACQKVQAHRRDMDRFTSDATLYGTQADRVYMLDTDDVYHYRLAGQGRED